MKTGETLIKEERHRVITKEGWTPEHDDTHANGELFQAALCYLRASQNQLMPDNWPWTESYWKPKDSLSNLIRAGQLVMAERERLGRLQESIAHLIDLRENRKRKAK